LFSSRAGPDVAAYVTAAYQVQKMDPIRNLTPLSAANPPIILALPIPGCGDSTSQTACPLAAFAKRVETKTSSIP
jgi:hypothetical protein